MFMISTGYDGKNIWVICTFKKDPVLENFKKVVVDIAGFVSRL